MQSWVHRLAARNPSSEESHRRKSVSFASGDRTVSTDGWTVRFCSERTFPLERELDEGLIHRHKGGPPLRGRWKRGFVRTQVLEP